MMHIILCAAFVFKGMRVKTNEKEMRYYVNALALHIEEQLRSLLAISTSSFLSQFHFSIATTAFNYSLFFHMYHMIVLNSEKNKTSKRIVFIPAKSIVSLLLFDKCHQNVFFLVHKRIATDSTQQWIHYQIFSMYSFIRLDNVRNKSHAKQIYLFTFSKHISPSLLSTSRRVYMWKYTMCHGVNKKKNA